jgi:hypothetical protein
VRQCCVGWPMKRGWRASDAWVMLVGARLGGRHAGSVPGRGHHGTTQQDSHVVSPVDPGSHVATAPGDASHRSKVSKLTQEIEMFTIHQCRPAVSVFVAVLAFALCTPFAVNAEEEVIVEEQEEQILAAAPAAPSWDETSGYGSVEASRAEVSTMLSGELISGQEQALAFAAAAAMLWDETSGYGSVEASRAVASALFAPVAGPSWDDTSGYGSVEASRAEMALDRALADC